MSGGIPVIVLDREQPHARGRLYGERAEVSIARTISLYRDWIFPSLGTSFKLHSDQIAGQVQRWRVIAPEYLEEIEGIAEGSGHSMVEILAVNARPSVGVHSSHPAALQDGCTSWVALPPSTANGHVLVGQNWDFFRGAAENIVILHIREPGRPHQLVLTEAGQLGRQGANAAGIALQANGLSSPPKNDALPTTFLRRRLLSRPTLKAAMRTATAAAGNSGNLLLADRLGSAVDVEISDTAVSILPPIEGSFVHANHFISPGEHGSVRPAPTPESLARQQWLSGQMHMLATKEGITADAMMDLARVTFDGSTGICCHPSVQRTPTDWQTIASTVTDLTDGIMWVAAGPPCEHPYAGIGVRDAEQVGWSMPDGSPNSRTASQRRTLARA
jgi:isopenicillin-N N-acyltransferase-like protein